MVVRGAVLVCILNSACTLAAPPTFDVLPRVCVAQADESCQVQLSAWWPHPEAVCISASRQLQDALYCQHGSGEFTWSAKLSADLTVYLLAQDSGAVLAQRQIKLLRPAALQLQPRRQSWSIF